jgi:hypothetical protein
MALRAVTSRAVVSAETSRLPAPTDDDEEPRRPRRIVLLGVTGAVVTVLAVAGFASDMFSYATPTRNESAPQDVRESLPNAPTSKAPSAPSTSGPASIRPPSAPSSPSADASSSPSASATSESPSPSLSTTPSQTPTTAAATASLAPAPNQQSSSAAPVLRRGDHGPAVTELQLRLRQLNLYTGGADGSYSSQVEAAVRNYQSARGIQTDEPGVYGAATRASLESETSKP